MSVVCEAARNVACTGARPAAMTNCLNFGNPETGEVGYELAESIEGMSLACEALGLPVVSGNVSLYNEHFGRPIHPTPVVGVVGVLDDAELAVRAGFREAGDVVLLAGDGETALDGSAYQKVVLGEHGGRIPEPDLDGERAAAPVPRRRGRAAAAAKRARRRLRQASPSASPSRRSPAASGAAVDADDLFGEGDGRVRGHGAARTTSRRCASWPATCRCARSAPSAARRSGSAPPELSLAEAAALHDAAIPNAVGA